MVEWQSATTHQLGPNVRKWADILTKCEKWPYILAKCLAVMLCKCLAESLVNILHILVYAWQTFGECLANASQTFGEYLANASQTFGCNAWHSPNI